MVELQRAQMADSYKVSFIKKFLAKQPNKRATARDIVEAFEKENPRTSGSSIPTALSNLSNMGILFKYKSPIKGSLIEYTLAETEAIPFASIPEQKEEEPKMATIPVPSPPVAKLVNEMENTIVSIDSRVNAILNTMHSVEDSVAHAQGIWKQGFTEGMREGIKLGMELAK